MKCSYVQNVKDLVVLGDLLDVTVSRRDPFEESHTVTKIP